MTAALMPLPKMQFTDTNGNPLAGGKVYTYAAGTSTPLATYTDQSGVTTNTNPVVLDSRGEASIWIGSSSYKIILKTSDDTIVWTVDGVSGGENAENVTYSMPGGAVTRTAQDKFSEFPSLADYGGSPPTVPWTNQWYWDMSHNQSSSAGGSYEIRCTVPATVQMAGGGNVQGVALGVYGSTSASTPNSGFAEVNAIRLDYTVNSSAGNKLQCHLINGLLTVSNDEGGTGNEGAVVIGTMRASGPTSGTAAVGIWGADLHVEKGASVLDGKMVGLEVGVHKSPALGAARCRGIDLWSGDRSGIVASRAGDAFYVHGSAGWTNFLKLVHTDESTAVCTLDKDGNFTVRSPSGNQATTFTTNAVNTTATLTVSGQTSGAAAVNGVLQAASGGQITFGSTTNHHLVVVQNNTECIRFISGFLYSSPSGVEYTGAGSAALGSNCPATTFSAPYRWIKSRTSDGSTVYYPVWK